MKAVVWEDEGLGAKYHDEEIPADLKDKAIEYRQILIEAAVELDDDAMTAYLDGTEPSEEVLNGLIRKAVRGDHVHSDFLRLGPSRTKAFSLCSTPSFCICRRRSIAKRSRALMWIREKKSSALPGDDEPFSMLAFKIMDDPFVGTITFARVYSGHIESGTTVLNSTKDKKERIGRMLLMHANNREDIKEAYSGDIVALAGLKDTRTGDTLCDLNKAVILERMEFPRPGHRDRDRAEVQGGPGKARRRAAETGGGRSVLPRLDRSGIRSDDLEGHGRASSRHQGRYSAPYL